MTPTLQQKIEEKVKAFEKNFWQNADDEKVFGWLTTNGIVLDGEQMSKIATPDDVRGFLRPALEDIAREAREEALQTNT